jgi:hypothetical protein
MAKGTSWKVPGTDPEMPVARRCFHRWLIAALLLVCGGLVAPQPARAGCGHYVKTTMQRADAGSVGLHLLAASGTLPDAPRKPEVPKPPASPCPGLRCSQDRPAPAPAPVLSAVPRIDLWGCLDLSAFTLRNPSSPFPFEDDCPPPSDRAERLSRPPW